MFVFIITEENAYLCWSLSMLKDNTLINNEKRKEIQIFMVNWTDLPNLFKPVPNVNLFEKKKN